MHLSFRGQPTSDKFSYTYVDYFPEYEVIADFHADATMQGGVTYPHYYIEPMEKKQDYTICRQRKRIQYFM